MKSLHSFVAVTLFLLAASLAALAQGSAFTYQGRLSAGPNAAHGEYEMTFTLFDAVTNGNVIAAGQTIAPVTVSNGLFTVALDFGAGAFNGAPRWLEISVNLFGSDMIPTTLAPRQPVLPSPYAIHAAQASGLASFGNNPLEIAVNGQRALRLEPTSIFDPQVTGAPNLIGGSAANFITADSTGSTIAGGGAVEFHGVDNRNFIASSFATIGGGRSNTVDTQASGATIAGGSQNTILSEGTHAVIGGGLMNWIAEDAGASTIAGGWLNRILGDGASIGGGYGNVAAGYATVAGGDENESRGGFSTISGGQSNTNRAEYAVIAGGHDNAIQTDAQRSAIGGGSYNRIELESFHSTIGGGASNVMEGKVERSTIGGGEQNRITYFANAATIAGGMNNRIQGPTGGSTISGGVNNRIEDEASGATISGGYDNVVGNNAGDSTIGGGVNNTAGAGVSVIGGGLENRIIYPGHFAVVGGGESNEAGDYAATVGGGAENSVLARYAAIGGGAVNRIASGAERSAIAGGSGNSIATNAGYAFIGGGGANKVRDEATYSAIVGGFDNFMGSGTSSIGGGRENGIGFNSPYSTIGGGHGNGIATNSGSGTVSGGSANSIIENSSYATIPGGLGNIATSYGFAAGRNAHAFHQGSFVWSDSSAPAFPSVATNEFAVRATGGTRLVSAVDGDGAPVAGVVLGAGAGAWASLSDRSAKENFAPANSREVLDRVAALPLMTWNYKSQAGAVRHLGPMAQDFHAAFGLGDSERTITTVDADGVALAAIQGLNQKLEEALNVRDAEVRALKLAVEELKRLLEASRR